MLGADWLRAFLKMENFEWSFYHLPATGKA